MTIDGVVTIPYIDYAGNVRYVVGLRSELSKFGSNQEIHDTAVEWDRITAWLRGDVNGYLSPITGKFVMTGIRR